MRLSNDSFAIGNVRLGALAIAPSGVCAAPIAKGLRNSFFAGADYGGGRFKAFAGRSLGMGCARLGGKT